MKLRVIATVALLVAALGLTTTVSATGFFVGSEDGTVTLESGKTVDGTAFMAGSSVVVEGTVQGDLYCAGENVTIKGKVDGDVICAGVTLKINGTVAGDVRAAGSDVTLGGVVAGSVLVAGSTVTTTDTFTVGRDFTAGGETVDLAGVFGRDAHVGANTVNMGAVISRDASFAVEKMSFDREGTAKIGGNLWYQAPQPEVVPSEVVAGSTQYERTTNESDGVSALSVLLSIIATVLTTVIVVLIAPRFVHTAATLSLRETLIASLAGLATLLLVPFVAALAFITVIGVWFGFILLIVWILLMLLAAVFTAYYVGTLVLRKHATNAVLVGAVGALVLAVLLNIPVVNILVVIVMMCVGVGMQVMHIKYQFSKDPYKIV